MVPRYQDTRNSIASYLENDRIDRKEVLRNESEMKMARIRKSEKKMWVEAGMILAHGDFSPHSPKPSTITDGFAHSFSLPRLPNRFLSSRFLNPARSISELRISSSM